jgi:hypothetical protein
VRTKRVYIAAPYGGEGEDVVLNIHKAIEAAEHVLYQTENWLPFVPHLFHLWHLVSPQAYEFWMKMDREWMQTCHAVVMVGDMSEGVKRDLNEGSDMGLPVFLTIQEFVTWTIKEG